MAPPLQQALDVGQWEAELEGDVDADFLLEGVRWGFHLVSERNFEPVDCDNYSSTSDPKYRDLVEKQILLEIEEGRYEVVSEKPTIVSALGVIPKSSGGIRLIHDASRPYGLALNDYAKTESKQKFQTLDSAVDLLSQGAFLAKVDLKSAYRYVPVHPDDFAATGLKWRFKGDTDVKYMVDKRLPFGAKFSPGIFHRLTQSVRRMMARKGFSNIVVYLDDFLCVSETKEHCLLTLNTLLALLRRLGFAIAWEKVEGPSNILTFLGIEIDTLQNELRLPSKKLAEFAELVDHMVTKKRVSLKQLQKLAGKLNWASGVVRGGRTYLRRILDLMKPLRHAKHKICVTVDMREDLRWWQAFLRLFNGKRAIQYERETVTISVDASVKAGGIWVGNDWRYVEWKHDLPEVKKAHINVKETAVVLLAARQWGARWAGCKVMVCTDNTTAMYAINKGTSKSPEIMWLLRQLFWLSCVFDFEIKCQHIPGTYNVVADCISRLYEDDRLDQLESMLGYITPLFACLWPYIFVLHMSYASFLSLLSQILRWLRSASRYARGWRP